MKDTVERQERDKETGDTTIALLTREIQQEPATGRLAEDQHPGTELTKEQWARLDNLDRMAGEINPQYLDIHETKQRAFWEQCQLEREELKSLDIFGRDHYFLFKVNGESVLNLYNALTRQWAAGVVEEET